jgi:hypothetical protein
MSILDYRVTLSKNENSEPVVRGPEGVTRGSNSGRAASEFLQESGQVHRESFVVIEYIFDMLFVWSM